MERILEEWKGLPIGRGGDSIEKRFRVILLRGPEGYVEWFRKGDGEVGGYIRVCSGKSEKGGIERR